jgi:hypothetical protein
MTSTPTWIVVLGIASLVAIFVSSPITQAANSPAGGQTTNETVRLDDLIDGKSPWELGHDNGLKAANAKLTVLNDQPAPGQHAVHLTADLTGPGLYAQAGNNLAAIKGDALTTLHFKLRTATNGSIAVRLVDATGQVHQPRLTLIGDSQWHDITLNVPDTKGEHWGGANDGKWHDPAKSVAFLISAKTDPDTKKPALDIGDITATIAPLASSVPASFKEAFEAAAPGTAPAGWTVHGDVRVDAASPFAGKQSLALTRTLENIDKPCDARSAPFAVAAGVWQFSGAIHPELKSPDSSYNGAVTIECLDGTGGVVQTLPVVEAYGEKTWQPFTINVPISAAATQARFMITMNKANGVLHVDDLGATFIGAPPAKVSAVDRIMFSCAQPGNVLFPTDPKTFTVQVDTLKPLSNDDLNVSVYVCDFWGAEVTKPVMLPLTQAAKKDGKKSAYTATLDLSKTQFSVGKYYELHARVSEKDKPAFDDFSSFAILPEAITKAYKPEEIPFTARDWENRLKEHFDLSDRIGIRIVGVKGTWAADPPYKPTAPLIDSAKRLQMGVLTSTPINLIEYHRPGYEKYDEKALREGVKNWIATFGNVARPLIVDLGNEPHGTGDRVKENIRAYKIVYDEIKKIDPTIFVLGTAVGPDEEYFQDGFQDCCDAYDFHVYEDALSVRKTLLKYQDLFAKYHCAKPVYATELGLNAQGLPRDYIAGEMVRKFSYFFGTGGANASWFDLAYPDPDAKLVGGSGDAFNAFDGRYRHFAPRIDAIMYYNMVNGICVKKYVTEANYDGGIHAFLFTDKDGHHLQTMWADRDTRDVFVPLPGVDAVTLIQIDGTRTELAAGGKGVTLTASSDPVLLLYNGGDNALAKTLPRAPATFDQLPASIIKGISTGLAVHTTDAVLRAELQTPAFWTVGAARSPNAWAVTVPVESDVRVGNIAAVLYDADHHAQGLLARHLLVAGVLSLAVSPQPASEKSPPGVTLTITNNGDATEKFSWAAALSDEFDMKNGFYESPSPATAFFAQAPSGQGTIEPHGQVHVTVPLSGVAPQTVYRVTGSVTDSTGRTASVERFVAGFVAVPHATSTIALDGKLDEPDWNRAPVCLINDASQYRSFASTAVWKGPADLSAKVQFLWDEKNLYIGVTVRDDVFRNVNADSEIWSGDSVQMLIDPSRGMANKAGKYDLSVGVGTKGPQAWCALSADVTQAPPGEAKEIQVSTSPATDHTGGMVYKIAIPWTRLAPFKPGDGDLGLSLGLNEDDGNGRHSLMSWFGDTHAKLLDFVGDLMLQK